MRISKAVITAAGRGQRTLPLQTLIDSDGAEKSVLSILIAEVLRAGVEEICVVVRPGDEQPYAKEAGDQAGRLRFVPQENPLGYGHAVYCAREFVGNAPFLHLVGDHLYISRSGEGCASHLVHVAENQACSVSAVQPTRESLLPYFGTVGGQRVPERPDLYRIERVIEKPTPTKAEQQLIVPGLRAGHYLCFFGMHVLTPSIFTILKEQIAASNGRGGITLAGALNELARQEQYLALEMHDLRYDIGVKYGLMNAQIALALSGKERDLVLSQLLELLAIRELGQSRTSAQPMSFLVEIITAQDPALRNRSLDAFAQEASLEELLDECAALEAFRLESENLYERVRALFFLYAIHRFHLPLKRGIGQRGLIPYEGYLHLLNRRFEEAIKVFQAAQDEHGPTDSISSALAAAYHSLGFQTLADQVRRSVRSVRGNQWMFRTGHPADYPLRVREDLRRKSDGLFPVLMEATPVRMDLTHSGWSDIFFLGMDFPEGARVINTSIDLSVRRDGLAAEPRPPVEAYFRVIDEPVLRLASVDLGATTEITTLAEVFDFARDYLGLLKAAVIASGLVPPGMEGADQPLSDLLSQLVGPGNGIEIVSRVNGIPKGSRLAVSTNLLACLTAVCMRATGQADALTGQLSEEERRLVAARAILGEWLGGSGGGWQDSGGAWPGMKLIQGETAGPDDPEYQISRGRLLPKHRILNYDEVSALTREQLQDSLVLVHGGMAQDVGPILEMVTEKYLLRSEAEWAGRQEAIVILDEILTLLHQGDVQAIGAATQRNFQGPIQTIIPWAGNLYTDTLIQEVARAFGEDFWGFWMLGGMSGGGMGFIFEPSRREEAQERLRAIMSQTKRSLEKAVPFAMEPVVYDFAINEQGTFARLFTGTAALMPPGYYTQAVPGLLRKEPRELSPVRRAELDRFGQACRNDPDLADMVQTLFDRLLPQAAGEDGAQQSLAAALQEHGFDPVQHEQIRADLRGGHIGLAQNRLPVNSLIRDVQPDEIGDATAGLPTAVQELGLNALVNGEVAVVSLAGGAGSRWTKGAGVVKAINPFVKLDGRYRSFLEVHLAKSRRRGRLAGTAVPHIITTSYLTHDAISGYLARKANHGYEGPLKLSPGQVVGLRMIPMARDLRFAWEEMPQQLLDEQAQKMRESLHAALINWAEQTGEASDYTDNLTRQCLHPVGHWYEIPNLLRNGVLAELLDERPQLNHLMLHNVDTVGADLDPAVLGYHIQQGGAMTVEVISRRIEDRGGGLACIDGHIRLIEGLALPREEIEFGLSYYNSNTMWLAIDPLLAVFGLTRGDLGDVEKVTTAVRELAARMPTYITIKDVKKRWGHGQEDVYPVTQFEKLWGDMTALPEMETKYLVVPRLRGQQLKEVDQLDGWLRDGSAAYLASICDW